MNLLGLLQSFRHKRPLYFGTRRKRQSRLLRAIEWLSYNDGAKAAEAILERIYSIHPKRNGCANIERHQKQAAQHEYCLMGNTGTLHISRDIRKEKWHGKNYWQKVAPLNVVYYSRRI
ncbi:hypothetical protein GALL_426900 [mine drainage metagenome]|uniref:Transposase n=1 Tax=mine drainage metagenome TaxID=410659 RepID=A0A1J5PXL3_9ZZZZ